MIVLDVAMTVLEVGEDTKGVKDADADSGAGNVEE